MKKLAFILPAFNEAEALPHVLGELRTAFPLFPIAVGANGCTDTTAIVARAHDALVGETPLRGYGYGCIAAIEAINKAHPDVEAYVFLAADGANDPADLPALIDAYKAGFPMVLGQRTRFQQNFSLMTCPHILANRSLGAWCGILTGRFYSDLGPFRILSRTLFESLQMREFTYGWTIEPQILCARLGIPVAEIDVRERPRLAGEQKVSHVNWRRTISVGWDIVRAGWRSRWRQLSIETYPWPTPKTHRITPKDSPHPI